MAGFSTHVSRNLRTIEDMPAIDVVAKVLEPAVRKLTRSDNAKRVLSGTVVGHRLHPALTDVPIGCWTAASTIDALAWGSGGHARAATRRGRLARDGTDRRRRACRIGRTCRRVTAGSGWCTWRRMARRSCSSLPHGRARRRGHHLRGALLGAMGLGAVTVGGYLGGHLVFVERAGVNADVPVLDDGRWHTACRADELISGEALGVVVDGVRVVLVREDARVWALAAVCSHAGGPLEDGEVHGASIVCPWHGSIFCVIDGAVERGPATVSQPAYETRAREATSLRYACRLSTSGHEDFGHHLALVEADEIHLARADLRYIHLVEARFAYSHTASM